jgi:hypothetical protein
MRRERPGREFRNGFGFLRLKPTSFPHHHTAIGRVREEFGGDCTGSGGVVIALAIGTPFGTFVNTRSKNCTTICAHAFAIINVNLGMTTVHGVLSWDCVYPFLNARE